MGQIPPDAKWFIAQLVEEFRVEGCKGNAVHINYVLIEARTPIEAYRKAMELGKKVASEYENPQGKKVTHRFIGLRDLDVIFDPLEHGCELTYVERLGVSRAALGKLVRRKRDLEAFRPIPLRRPSGRPDYSSKEIVDMVTETIKKMKSAQQSASPNRRPVRPREVRTSPRGRHR